MFVVNLKTLQMRMKEYTIIKILPFIWNPHHHNSWGRAGLSSASYGLQSKPQVSSLVVPTCLPINQEGGNIVKLSLATCSDRFTQLNSSHNFHCRHELFQSKQNFTQLRITSILLGTQILYSAKTITIFRLYTLPNSDFIAQTLIRFLTRYNNISICLKMNIITN